MTQYIPITLQGNNLGQRHRYLNSLVAEAFKSSVPFDSIQDLPEDSPIDRLFKIDLASKYRNVKYVIQNLKDPDLLYVARALKCKWLLETQYAHIINVCYLENELFPAMTEIAVNRMQHSLQHYLCDPTRCCDFYKHYKETEFKKAVPFLWHCSNDYILEEFNNIIDKIEPKQLKVLSEKVPQVTKVFYESLESDNIVLKHYLENEVGFFSNLKFILKPDPETFFKVLEKYFNKHSFMPYHSDVTKFIMLNHKGRFFEKPELYTAWLLDTNVLAKNLSPEEVKDLIIKLAKAEYLQDWFNYKAVEPLIKRLDKQERVKLKNLVFVDKVFGDKIKDWPYTPPAAPVLEKTPGFSIFQDKLFDCRKYGVMQCCLKKRKTTKRCIIKAKHVKETHVPKCRTLLDQLFDKYRFASFEHTLFELQKRLRTESSPQNRQFIMLVLVSKSGGREDSLRILLKLLSQYRNEPVNLRAAIVRSLAKRACVWRLPPDLWNNLLEWGHGLGLDGSPPEADCDEGLHAVVLRSLLAGESLDPTLSKAFYKKFTNFTQYPLTSTERTNLRSCLPNLLLDSGKSLNGHKKRQRLDQLLDTLAAYGIQYSKYPGVIDVIAAAAQEDPNESKYLLQHLYWARAGRRQLFKENFSVFQNNASYVNALRHDASILNAIDFEVILKDSGLRIRFEQFFRKLVVYFSEIGGLAEQYYIVIREWAKSYPKKSFARPLAILAGKDITSLLEIFSFDPKERRPKTPRQSLAEALRANGHLSKPPIDLGNMPKSIGGGWEAIGVKAINNIVSRTPMGLREEMVKKLLTSKKTLRLGLALTKSEETKSAIYKKLALLRPGIALKLFLSYLKMKDHGSSFRTIWNAVKPLITELDYTNRKKLVKNLQNIKSVPSDIAAEFYVLLYEAFLKIDKNKARVMLCHIGNICSDVDETFFYDVFHDFLENEFVEDKVISEDYLGLYIDLIGKFLLLCKTEETQSRRFKVVGEPLLNRIGWFFNKLKKNNVVRLIDILLYSLKYSKVYFDIQYVSCEPIFERVVSWLHNMLPIHMWFEKYAHIHLTMLYHKSVRFCITNKPDLFTNDNFKGVDMLGNVYGKFVGHAYKDLEIKYFKSLRIIYRNELMNFLHTSFDYFENYDESVETFVIAFLKSILEETEVSESHFIAAYLFKVHKSEYFRYEYDKTGIERRLRETKNDELRFCIELDNLII